MAVRKCHDCGKEGEIGEDFYRARPSYCKKCTGIQINRHHAEENEASRAHAVNHGELWGSLEIEMLLEGRAENMTILEIAEMVGRTHIAVKSKLEAIRQAERAGKCVTPRSTAGSAPTNTGSPRNPNYVASQPDEDRWWEPNYYKNGAQS